MGGVLTRHGVDDLDARALAVDREGDADNAVARYTCFWLDWYSFKEYIMF